MILPEFKQGAAVLIETSIEVKDPFQDPILKNVTSVNITILEPFGGTIINNLVMTPAPTLTGRYSFIWQSSIVSTKGTYKTKIIAIDASITSIVEEAAFVII